jgi:hypothetical protein
MCTCNLKTFSSGFHLVTTSDSPNVMTLANVGLIDGAGLCISGDACHGVIRNTGDNGNAGGTEVDRALVEQWPAMLTSETATVDASPNEDFEPVSAAYFAKGDMRLMR